MQLIMDTEPTVDIKEEMSTLEESLDKNLMDPIENLKSEIVNGNKENIESQKNVIECRDIVNGEDLKYSDDSTDDIKLVQEEDDQKGDTENKTENYDSQEDVCKPKNGNVNGEGEGDKQIGEDLSSEEDFKTDIVLDDDDTDNITNSQVDSIELEDKTEEDIGEDDQVKGDIINEEKLENIDQNLDSDIVEVEVDQSDDIVKVLDNVEGEIINNEIQNTSLSEKDDSDVNDESIKSVDFEENIVENNVREKLDITKTDIETIDVETGEITENDKIEKDCELMDTGVKEITEEEKTTKGNNLLHAEVNEGRETGIVTSDFEMFDNKLEKSAPSNTITKALEVLDTENKLVEETSTAINETIIDNEDEEIKEISADNFDVIDMLTDKTAEVDDKQQTILPQETLQPEIKPDNKPADDVMTDIADNKPNQNISKEKDEILDVDEFMKDIVEENEEEPIVKQPLDPKKPPICKLSNTLDILSDDDEEPPQSDEPPLQKETDTITKSSDKQCINIVEDDDDIMLIDEDTDMKNSKGESIQPMETEEKKIESAEEHTIDLEKKVENSEIKNIEESLSNVEKEPPVPEVAPESIPQPAISENKTEVKQEKIEEVIKKPLVPENFLKGFKKNLADMTREELEEFCVLKIVEGIVDRSNLSDIKSKLKSISQNIDEYKRKAMMLTKQNRDLQLVLKSVQEEQKNKSDSAIVPLKITRSVGMQVLMNDKTNPKKKNSTNSTANSNNSVNNKQMNSKTPNQSPRPQKSTTTTQQIPVPRLVPAATNPAVKAPSTLAQANTSNNTPKTQTPINGMKVATSVQKSAEKRTHNRVQSVTVDLTDDEPPAKVTPRSSPAPPVRLVSPSNLLTRPQFTQALNSPRKVYIPISGPQGQNIRPGQTIMIKSTGPGQRLRGSAPPPRMPQNQVRLTRVPNHRHPAPLPECMKQYQPPNWKSLPPAPDLKLSKVENGIVISWKIEGYQDDSYEEIASYQLYAYQETSSPPNTALWKKIGDVKALPLPMACTLTQFMAGFKYYFAVRAVDVRSRLGPFSLPGSILLLNKM